MIRSDLADTLAMRLRMCCHTRIPLAQRHSGQLAGQRFYGNVLDLWTLQFDLRTDQRRQRFIDAYGLNLIDENILQVTVAIVAFY